MGKHIEIYDWSCGQALATIVLLEYLGDRNIDLSIDRVTLIEPSEIALKRASLHVKHFAPEVRMRIVLKDMDSLEATDVNSLDESVKIHLFSNILDVEAYSMRHLVEIIKHGIKGNNYMICVSPYINDVKTARFDSFVNSFGAMSQFEIIFQDVASRGQWINNWTKLIKTFKVKL
jgi:tRNA A58 N-methylase Trm61